MLIYLGIMKESFGTGGSEAVSDTLEDAWPILQKLGFISVDTRLAMSIGCRGLHEEL